MMIGWSWVLGGIIAIIVFLVYSLIRMKKDKKAKESLEAKNLELKSRVYELIDEKWEWRRKDKRGK
jgi:ABC-type transport system involved in cytochrome bd biosynthesis fused ATPase/permease subunit